MLPAEIKTKTRRQEEHDILKNEKNKSIKQTKTPLTHSPLAQKLNYGVISHLSRALYWRPLEDSCLDSPSPGFPGQSSKFI